ncbi:MAG: ribonuclease HII [Cytophagales bacterium]|nr:MAG: ribonuclease HII [Cytophagales bacterium]
MLSASTLRSFFHPTYLEAGVDEVGRGSLIGPVVAAAVILPKNFSHLHLKDSKLLSKTERETIAEEIKLEALDYSIASASVEEIDTINILQASFLAMHRAIAQLKIVPELLLVDGNRFSPYPAIVHQCFVKGDNRFFSIAAASVLAKTYRDALITEYASEYPLYDWAKNMGYATAKHRKAIAEHGYTPLHRKSFHLKNTITTTPS